MTLGGFLRWWLRGLRATAVTVDEALTQRRLRAQIDDELARDIADLRALQARTAAYVPLTVSLESLWERPTVTPDLRGYTFVRASNDLAVVDWLRFEWPDAWWDETDFEKVRTVAGNLLVLREAQIAGMVEL